MEATSLSLLDRLRQQTFQDDWLRFVAVYKPFIEHFIRFDASLAADAEDVCQDVLAKVAEHLPRFQRQRDGSFRAWLKTITVNQVNLFWRRRQRERKIGLVGEQSLIDGLLDPRNELSQIWDREYNRHVLRRLIDLVQAEFSPTTWEAFRLRVLEEKSTDEVACELRLSKNAVDIAKSRVLNRLRREAAELLDM